jgi:hypothetical protein
MEDARSDRNELLKIPYSYLVLSPIENEVSDLDVELFVVSLWSADTCGRTE